VLGRGKKLLENYEELDFATDIGRSCNEADSEELAKAREEVKIVVKFLDKRSDLRQSSHEIVVVMQHLLVQISGD
jgi:hypothetical protein